MKRWYLAATVIVICIAATALFGLAKRKPAPVVQPVQPSTARLVNQSVLDQLPHKSASSADTSHLAGGILPPTDSWISGMVLQKIPLPVYPMPNSFLAKDSGFEIGLPAISSGATEIDGHHTAGLPLSNGGTGFQLTHFDKVSATLAYHDATGTLASVTLAEGSPFVFYTAAKNHTITIMLPGGASISQHAPQYVAYRAGSAYYVVSSPQSTINLSGNTLTIKLNAGQRLSLYTLPGTSDFLKPYNNNPLEAVTVQSANSDSQATTTLQYRTANARPTVFAAMPYMQLHGRQIGSYQSIWGTLPVYAGNSFSQTVPAVAPGNSLSLGSLSQQQKVALSQQLGSDTGTTAIDKQDSYYAGKQLARAANLLDIAEQLHQTASANKLKSLLAQAFDDRLTNTYFYYDTTLKGVAASNAAFGSQDFNDHHFHYGYWLYAASILGRYDTGFANKYKDRLNLLAADIADYQISDDFPLQRYFDPYAGHSWAAGLAPFADGNNQESSSEAIHAWNGLALWGSVTHNSQLQQTGQWMLANEARAAQAAWRNPQFSEPYLKAYTSPLTSLNFGGKRTYATFFSDAPAAKLGIQLIPMDPAMRSFAGDRKISTVLAASMANNYNQPLGDYDLMYAALNDPAKAADIAKNQTAIDDGNSRTYLLAWLYALR